MPSSLDFTVDGLSSRKQDQRPTRTDLMEATNTAIRRHNAHRGSDTRSARSRHSFSPQARPPPEVESAARIDASVRSCPFETTFVNKERRFPMYNGERRPLTRNDHRPMQALQVKDDIRLSNEIEALYNGLLPTAQDAQSKHDLTVKLERLLNEEWPGKDFTVHAFGSTENLLATHKSDLDVCIETEWTGFERQVCELSRFMARSGMENVVCRSQAKVPVVAIYDPKLKVSCDMNINNTLALRNTKLVKTYMQLDQRARKLTYAVKQWASDRALNEAVCNTLTSYTWTLMVINFLQTRKPIPVLPSLQQWPHEPMPPVNGTDVSFADDIDKYDTLKLFASRNTESLGALLFGFFRYYAFDFDYERDVASVRLGRVISRREKGYPSDNMFCVEEPFTIARNLGNTADMGSHRGIHHELQRACKMLAQGDSFSSVSVKYDHSNRPPTRLWTKAPSSTKIKNGRQNISNRQSPHQRTTSESGFYQPAIAHSDDIYSRHNNGYNDPFGDSELHIDRVQSIHWQYLGEPDSNLQPINVMDPTALGYYRQRMMLTQHYYGSDLSSHLRSQARSRSQPSESHNSKPGNREARRSSVSISHKTNGRLNSETHGPSVPARSKDDSVQSDPFDARQGSSFQSLSIDDQSRENQLLPRMDNCSVPHSSSAGTGLSQVDLLAINSYYPQASHDPSCSEADGSQTSAGLTLASSRSSPVSASGFPSPLTQASYLDAFLSGSDCGLKLPPPMTSGTSVGYDTISSHFPLKTDTAATLTAQDIREHLAANVPLSRATYASKVSTPTSSRSPQARSVHAKTPRAADVYEAFPPVQSTPTRGKARTRQ